MRIAVLIVAAGRGERFGAGLPKQYAFLGGRPVLRHTAETFLRHPRVDAVRVVIGPGDEERYESAVRGLAGLLPPVVGGAARQESVRRGLESLAGEPVPDLVLIHDAA